MRQVAPCPLGCGEVMEVNLVSDRLLPEQETLVAEDVPMPIKYQLQIEKANERLRKAEKRLLKAKNTLKEIKMFWDLG